MIVICTGCQARFRVADDKIGPRGAKVRCTRCQSVFVVQLEAPEPPPAPKIDLDLTPGIARRTFGRDPSAAQAGGASVIPFPAHVPSSPEGSPAPDPFAAAGFDVYGDGAPAGDDPFARAAAGLSSEGAAPPAGDPFAPAPAADPFAGTRVSGATALPVTDLSQLLGGAAGAPSAPPVPVRAPSPPPRAEPPRAAQAAPAARSGPFAEDLSLEERSGPLGAGPVAAAPAPFADPSDVMPADGGMFGMGGDLAPDGPGDGSLALATDPTPAPAPVAAPPLPAPNPFAGDGSLELPDESAWVSGAPSAPPELGGAPGPGGAPPRAPPVQPVAVDPGPPAAAAAAPSRPAEPPIHRIRSAALGALALVALLVLALALRAVVRGDVPFGPAAFRPSTLLRSLADRPAGPFELTQVRSGVYPQGSGSALLFVRGVVVCRAPAPVAGVTVRAELVRDGQVLARGEVLAGAVPSPEEVYRATDRAAMDALAAELKKRAPERVTPGDRLGFLIALGEAPPDPSGTTVRLQATAEAAR